ncbi:MAG: SRPBCC domain-containing protein [Pseudomonadota bacterium]
MLIRKPPEEVFSAFVEPRIIEKFWLKRASERLAKDASVEWEFMVEGAVDTVKVTEFVENQIIAFKWSDGIAVRMNFDLHNDGDTRLSITTTGFSGTDAPAQAINTTEGFAIVVCDLKSFLETGRSGNMVRDKAVLITAGTTAC